MTKQHDTDKLNPETDDIELVKQQVERQMDKIKRTAKKAENLVTACKGKQKIIRVVLDE